MRNVYLVEGSRTPFIKALTGPNPWSAADLAVASLQPLIAKMPFDLSEIGELITGCVAPSADEANIARIIALRVGCADSVCGWTVQRNCASGLQAIDCAVKDIAAGRHEFVLAGGTEAMSRAPLLFQDSMVKWLSKFQRSKHITAKLKALTKLRPNFFVPVIALLKGLTDPVVNMSMGQTTEKLAHIFGITREQMDEFALESHLKAVQAMQQERFKNEVTPLFAWDGKVITSDNGVRADSSMERLAKLRPVFDKPYGSVTAGNSSQVTDGAAFMLLASEDAVKKHKLKPKAKIVDIAWSGLDPTIMGLGPAYAISKVLDRNKLGTDDIDYWEINEAFAGQVIACLKTLSESEFSNKYLDRAPYAPIDKDKLNTSGGAIALGHPVGASGARISLHAVNALENSNGKLGVATMCIGGGQGGAVLLERVGG